MCLILIARNALFRQPVFWGQMFFSPHVVRMFISASMFSKNIQSWETLILKAYFKIRCSCCRNSWNILISQWFKRKYESKRNKTSYSEEGMLLGVFGSQLGYWLVALASVCKVLEGADKEGLLGLWSEWRHQPGKLGWEGNSGTITNYALFHYFLADAETTNVRLDCVAGMCHCRRRFIHSGKQMNWRYAGFFSLSSKYPKMT